MGGAAVAVGAPVMGWVGGMVGVKLGLMLSSGIMVLALIIVLVAMKQSAYQRRIE